MRKYCLHKTLSYTAIRKYFITTLSGFLGACLWISAPLTAGAVSTVEERIAINQALPVQSNDIVNWPDGPVVSAETAILMDADSGAVLYAKNIDQKGFPASTTKLLTTILVTEHCALDEVVTFSRDAVFGIPRESSNIAIDAGEELTIEQCLNAILIASANEVSYGVAEHISGTWDEFAVLMNEKAKELGCKNSNFINPNGLPDENHYTTAYDLASIARAFFANELLCKISSSGVLRIPPTDKQPDDIIEYSRNLLLPGKKYAYEYLVGSKTGYTDSARSTLVSCAEKDGMKLICVVMKDESPNQFEDTTALFNYGFSNFDKLNISETETKYNLDNSSFFYSSNDIFGSSRPILSLNSTDCIILPKTASFADTQSTISYDTVSDNEVALITYTYQGQYIGSVSVDLASDASSSYTFDEEIQASQEPEKDSGGKVIFINILKVFLWIVGIAAAAIAVLWIRAFIHNYQFSGKDRSRRGWRKRRKIRRIRQPQPAPKKKAKRPSRFRDYDF